MPIEKSTRHSFETDWWIFYGENKSVGFSIDIIGFVFRINNFLAAIEPVIAGKHVAECDS